MVANGVFLCIISPIRLLILGALSGNKVFWHQRKCGRSCGVDHIDDPCCDCSSYLYLQSFKTARYEYLEEEIFDTEYGVISLVN